MNRNAQSIITLIRNRINNSNLEFNKCVEWFLQKGLVLENPEDELFFIKNNSKIDSEFSNILNTCIFRGNHLLCFSGPKIKKYTLKQAKELPYFIWHDTTIFLDVLDGTSVYMYFDIKDEKWHFSSDNKFKSSYEKLLLKQIYNLYSVAEPCHTYFMKFCQKGKNAGLYVESMCDNKRCKELNWKVVDKYTFRMGLRRPKAYKFEGFKNIEKNDLPIIAMDKSLNKIIIQP